MPTVSNRDPRYAPIQITFRIPWYWKQQLETKAFEQGITVPTMVIEALEACYPPDETAVPAAPVS